MASTKTPKTSAAKTAATKVRAKIAAANEKPATLKTVATKGRKKVSSVVHLTRDASLKLIDSQREIWLAGLGALAKMTTATGTKGEQAFEALVRAGEELEAQARSAIDSNADLLKVRVRNASDVVDESLSNVSDAFDARVKQALARLGYPKN